MKSFFLIMLLLSYSLLCRCQYYYTDIVAAQISQKEYMALKINHVHHVSAISYESDGEQTEDFTLTQDISPEARTITLNSSYLSAGASSIVNTYKFNKLYESADNKTNISNAVKYIYDSAGRLSSIQTITEDTFMKSHSEEQHIWLYKDDLPEKMLVIKDKNDTTEIQFVYDNGTVGEENWMRKGMKVETYYYYYNDKKQLTDVVRYNLRAKQMLPDFLFEYDAAGRVSQTTEIPAGTSDYMVWKYIYNPNGLKKSEFLFDKEKQRVGHIEFAYE